MKNIRIGVFGAGRGVTLAREMMLAGAEIVALCDCSEERRKKGAAQLGSVAQYEDFDKFIAHGMDAVILANYFHEHAPYAIECLARGIHVFSECISNGTMAEGVELYRAAKKNSAIYMLAENYPQMLFNLEMQKVCRGGTLGRILYAEGEYNHPGDPYDISFKKEYNYFPKHWRNFVARTYYITHSLAPLMRATGATPKRVSAYAVFAPPPEDAPSATYVGDRAAVVTMQNDDGSVFRVTGCAAFGAHHNAYRICGTKGQIENLRGMGGKVMLRYNAWEKPEGAEEVNLYQPTLDDRDAELIRASGHGGSDYLTARMFLDCLRQGKQPDHPFDAVAAIAMSSVAILSHRSMLEGGVPYDIPDFSEEAWCKKYENDRLSPFYMTDGREATLPCCSHTDYQPNEVQMKNYLNALGLS